MEADRPAGGNHVSASTVKLNDWFAMDVIVTGNRTQILVNGQTITDYDDVQGRYPQGGQALQVYSGDGAVEFRKIEIRELRQ
jgi:hypothetical protein